MRWYRAKTYERVQTGTDETRNPTYGLAATGNEILVRLAPWTRERDDTEGNRFDSISRTFLTKTSATLLEGVVALKVNGDVYGVDSMSLDESPIAIRATRTAKWE